MKNSLTVLLMLMVASGCLLAQSNEVAVTFGLTVSPKVTAAAGCGEAIPCPTPPPPVPTSPGKGFAWQATFAHRIASFGMASLALELPVVGTPSRSQDFLPFDHYSSLFFTPSVQVKILPGARVSPFASVGGGLARFEGLGGAANTGALQFGGGVDFKTPLPHLAVRVEGRDFISGKPNSFLPLGGFTSNHLQHVFAGGGIVLKF